MVMPPVTAGCCNMEFFCLAMKMDGKLSLKALVVILLMIA